MTVQADVPEDPVRSLDELFALAHALETEAADHYEGLAARMRALDLPEVAAVFEMLVAEERQHAAAVDRWARAETGEGPDPKRLRWQPPDPFDEETAQAIASSRHATAYRAFSLAVRNEERAFLLWTLIAARAADATIRAAAETMAMEELRHAALLRRERRRAFHAARAAGPAPAPPPPAAAHEIELGLADGLGRLAGSGRFVAAAAELRRLAAEADAMALEAGAGQGTPPVPSTEEVSLDGMQRLAERAAELYLDGAEAARDENALARLQSLAGRAIARMDRLRILGGG